MIYPAIPCLLTSNEKRCLEVSPLGGSDLTRSSQQRRQTGIMMIFSLRCGRLNKLVRGCQPESPISTPTYTVALVPGSLDKLSFFFFFLLSWKRNVSLLLLFVFPWLFASWNIFGFLTNYLFASIFLQIALSCFCPFFLLVVRYTQFTYYASCRFPRHFLAF